jgi:hypothetical protein
MESKNEKQGNERRSTNTRKEASEKGKRAKHVRLQKKERGMRNSFDSRDATELYLVSRPSPSTLVIPCFVNQENTEAAS